MIDIFLKTFSLVDRSTYWQAAGIIVLIILSVVLETLGIGLIFPFIKLIVNPEEIQNMPWLTDFLGVFNIKADQNFLFQLTLGLLGIWVLKNVLLLVIYYVQSRFSLSNMRLLSLNIYRHYLHGPYSLHLMRNSADLIQNVHFACTRAFIGSFVGFLTIASEAMIMVALAILLLVIEPVITLTVGVVIGGAVGLFYLAFRSRVISWGDRHLKSTKVILKSLQQGLGSIKEVKILGREEFLVDDLKQQLDEFVNVMTAKQVMLHVPRLWIETVTVISILGIVLFALSNSESLTSLFAVLSVFGVASLRLIPSMNRILIALNQINDAKPSVDAIHRDTSEINMSHHLNGDDADSVFSFSRSLEVQDLSFQFPNTNTSALQGINFKLQPGKSLGLVGPSGAGKSTLVDIILGLLEPNAGKVVADGINIATNHRAWRKHFGYVPQAIYLIDDSLRRNIALGLQDDEIDDEKVRGAIELAQLSKFIGQLPQGLDTNVGENGIHLSGGQRQRIGIARALYKDPKILILDEATSYLDSETEHEINQAIESLRGNKTLIIIAHRLSTVRRCDQLVFMDNGRVSGVGTFEELTANNRSFKNLVELSKL